MPFHSVFFGSVDKNPSVLAQMSDIARGVYTSAKRARDADSPAAACTYTNAINTVRLFIKLLGLVTYCRPLRFNSRKPSLDWQSRCVKLALLWFDPNPFPFSSPVHCSTFSIVAVS